MPTHILGPDALAKRRPFPPLPKAADRNGNGRGGLALFALNFLKHPRLLGTIFPSSRFLVARVLSRIAWDKCSVIVVYGPGVGQVTTGILRRMRPEATLIAIELNPDFVRFLRCAIDDPRLQLVSGSAADVRNILQQLGHAIADCIIAGIPFSSLNGSKRREILSETHAALANEGQLTVYQYSRAVRSAG